MTGEYKGTYPWVSRVPKHQITKLKSCYINSVFHLSGFHGPGLRESYCSNSLSSRTLGIRSTTEIPILLLLSKINGSKALLIQQNRWILGFLWVKSSELLPLCFPSNRITELSFQGFHQNLPCVHLSRLGICDSSNPP
jgi:hypothetical protein